MGNLRKAQDRESAPKHIRSMKAHRALAIFYASLLLLILTLSTPSINEHLGAIAVIAVLCCFTAALQLGLQRQTQLRRSALS
jgi:hypothetical protein